MFNANEGGTDMKVYTIGHTNHTLDDFLKLLKKNNINCIVDVRSTPYSKYTSQFNKKEIKTFLSINRIAYIHMGDEFGARRSDKELYTKEGYLDFDKTRRDAEFLKGVDRIKSGCKKGYNIALMCTEKDPIDCHRSIMVSKGLIDNNIEVEHIKDDGSIETQSQLEKRLLDKYFINREQVTFDIISGGNLSEDEMIDLAYKKRNVEIGYEINEGE